MKEIVFVDTTLRDGHQSLWAEGMTTGMMLPIARQIDRVGFDAIEIISPSHLKKCVRDLRDDPWERVREVAKRITKTPLRLLAGRVNAFQITPQSIYRLYMERMAANGLRQARISDEWNDLESWTRKVKVAREVGLEPIVNLIYSVSPKHTDDYFAQKTREAAGLELFRLCLKDPGGLLTPERTRSLVPAILKNSNGLPVELHTHCTTGLGPLCCLEAIQLNIRIINTAIPPLAHGPSNPSVFQVAANARSLGYTPTIDEAAIKPISEHFNSIAKLEGLPIGAPAEYDLSQYLHQVPGGMISNLRHQLRQVRMEDRLEQALDECVRVRADFGYPIMVTPLSQFVGSQAAINVIVGERYKEVTDQTIAYALGWWGQEGALSMDPEVKDKILHRQRAKEVAAAEPPDLTLQEVRRKLGGAGVSDEELILRWVARREDIEATYATGPAREYLSARQPLVSLIRKLAQRTDLNRVGIQKPGFSLVLEKRTCS